MDVVVSENLVAVLMGLAGITGLPGPAEVKKLESVATVDDRVHRELHRLAADELWVTDITECPTQGKFHAARCWTRCPERSSTGPSTTIWTRS